MQAKFVLVIRFWSKSNTMWGISAFEVLLISCLVATLLQPSEQKKSKKADKNSEENLSVENEKHAKNQLCPLSVPVEPGPLYVNGPPVYRMQHPKDLATVCPNDEGNNRLFLSGHIKVRNPGRPCGTPQKVLVDFWQANETGLYSQATYQVTPFGDVQAVSLPPPGPFTLLSKAKGINDPAWQCRLKIITLEDGFYNVSTVIPARYRAGTGWRATHIHVRITPLNALDEPMAEAYTTQLYFKNDKYNGKLDFCKTCHSDDPSLILKTDNTQDFKTSYATQNFLI